MGVADWYFMVNLIKDFGRQTVIRVYFHAFCGCRLEGIVIWGIDLLIILITILPFWGEYEGEIIEVLMENWKKTGRCV